MDAEALARAGGVVFTGEPDALEAVIPFAPRLRRSIAIRRQAGYQTQQVEPLGDLENVRILTSPHADDTTIVRLIAPPTTPPGTYTIQLECDGGVVDATVVVEETVHLSVQPSVLRLACRAKHSTTVDLMLSNSGNCSLVLGKRFVFGMLETTAVESAIGAALRPSYEPRRRIDVFSDELADRHGGLVRLRLSIDEPIPPGSVARASATINVGDEAVANREYHGLWRIADARVPVYISVGSDGRRRPRKEAS